jgi:AAA family ATP:ADP antiporter
VAAAACQAAGALRNRAYTLGVVQLLANPRVRGAATEALAHYGPLVCGTLGDMLDDEKLPIEVRSSIPKVLRLIPHQRSVDALLAAHTRPEAVIRSAALKALSRLRETAPGLSFGEAFLTQHVLNEAHHYYELSAAVAALRGYRDRPHSAVSLLARTMEERLRQSLERVFRLLGLRFPASEMYQVYLALARQDKEKHATAVELLDNVLDQNLKRVLLPMLETPERLLERGRELFGVEVLDAESTIRGLLGSQDAWVVACAMAAAAELRLRGLAQHIAQAARHAGAEVCEVARAAQAGLS